MKENRDHTGVEDKLDAIQRELRGIRVVLWSLLAVLVISVCALFDLGLAIVVILAGLFAVIVSMVIHSMVQKTRRARHEQQEFRRLSGRSVETTR